MENNVGKIIDKILITANLKLVTGLHIGASSDFSSIGTVDSIVVRDPLTKRPIIPGSSLKGKTRSLLARSESGKTYGTTLKDESPKLKRLFGSSDPIIFARLQFFDLFMNENSYKKVREMETDLYLTEVKYENTINRLTAVANPRQIERVPAGCEFDFKLVYNIENLDELNDDVLTIKRAIELLHADYLGGSGTRGYGRILLHNFDVKLLGLNPETDVDIDGLRKIFIDCN